MNHLMIKFKTTALFVALIFITLSSAWEKNVCGEIQCLNGAICIEGTCNCPSGYGGGNCSLILRDVFLGPWVGNQSFGSNPMDSDSTSKIVISAPNNSIRDILIQNFADQDTWGGTPVSTITATVNNANFATIQAQWRNICGISGTLYYSTFVGRPMITSEFTLRNSKNAVVKEGTVPFFKRLVI